MLCLNDLYAIHTYRCVTACARSKPNWIWIRYERSNKKKTRHTIIINHTNTTIQWQSCVQECHRKVTIQRFRYLRHTRKWGSTDSPLHKLIVLNFFRPVRVCCCFFLFFSHASNIHLHKKRVKHFIFQSFINAMCLLFAKWFICAYHKQTIECWAINDETAI